MPFHRTPSLRSEPRSPGPPGSISLVVTTYNWKEALARVLASAALQTRLPDEVIVADDGSRQDTADVIAAAAQDYPVPLRHVWQPDAGFRAARSRNLAIAAARGEYVLLLDGDMVLEGHFVADHARAARRGSFVQGSRVLTGPAFRERMLARAGERPTPFARGVSRRRNAVRWLPLSDAWLAMKRNAAPRHIKTCNQGWWREDLLRLNGFDERMEGWGREDVELAWRAHHAGIACRQLRFAGLAYHLHHQERHEDGASANDRLLAETRALRLTRCERGLDAHLEAARQAPLPDLRRTVARGPGVAAA
jgi:GT2 family glycosyltransferase